MSKENLIHIYCMPGMAASPKIFEFVDFPDPFVIHRLSWIKPNENEPIAAYALRMCERIEHSNPILLGVSFGGVLVQEMAKHMRNPRAKHHGGLRRNAPHVVMAVLSSR